MLLMSIMGEVPSVIKRKKKVMLFDLSRGGALLTFPLGIAGTWLVITNIHLLLVGEATASPFNLGEL